AISFLADANVEVRDLLSLGHVHGGFYRNLQALWNDIDDRISQAFDGKHGDRLTALFITGHSLGAAMAVIAAAAIFADERYARWRRAIGGIYTYGQPMVGDKEFARSCDERFGSLLFRHIYENDIVPTMPPVTAGIFKHSGSEYAGSVNGWVPREKAVRQAPTILFTLPIGAAAFVFKQFPALASIKLPYSINDHSPNGYLLAFRAAKE
ncbi:MAG TPA: hypothetical protein VMK12_16755, partial [Anaeromyxobacteraceae bacterium]|nr:hypothetical protein [Anaeromyxobacteraceae bacterium]